MEARFWIRVGFHGMALPEYKDLGADYRCIEAFKKIGAYWSLLVEWDG
jgi:hypothetical protein